MHLLRKYRGQAKNSPSKLHGNTDKNENGAESVESQSESGDENGQDTHKGDRVNEFLPIMLNFIRELVICCFVYLAYAAITNDPPKISKAPAAYPFFPKKSLVKDFYRGQIIEAIEQARSSDFSFLMFYAPWDAESQAVRQEFDIAANYMKDNIVFAAVNCWQPGSECRHQYNKVYRWPVLIAYPAFGTGIQYNGPLSAPYMISFLQKVMKPLKRAGDVILDFEEAFLVAELDPSPGKKEYSVYYSAALKYLEADPLARVSFYVKPVKYTSSKLTLYLWNQIRIIEFNQAEWKVENILQFVLKYLITSSSWASPSWSKSLLLSNHLEPGPTLILFTPKNPLYGASDYYMMLQEVSQEYKNCQDNDINFNLETKRLRNWLEHQHLQKACKLQKKQEKYIKTVPVTTNLIFSNTTLTNNHVEECYDVLHRISTRSNQKILNSNENIVEDYNTERTMYRTSMLNTNDDPKSMPNLKKLLHKEQCKTFIESQKIQAAIFESDVSKGPEKISVSALACSNQSLEFVAMNSLLHYNFAERLGIDLSVRPDKSAVVIINEKMETHYIMEGPVTNQNLRKFIRGFTNNTLTRSTNSSVDVELKNTPSYTFKREKHRKPTLYVEELNSRNFLDVVLKQNKVVLVLYYSKQCSHCNGISYKFLTLARKLSFVQNLNFARIDGDLNILPWEYTMEQFPTILYFPDNRKEESRVFPSDLPITVPNLLGFVLTNLSPAMRLHAVYSVCLHSHLEKDKMYCLSTVRNSTISLIEQTLRDYRKSNNRQRQILLHNLKQLRQLQFLFNHSPEDFKLIELYFKKLNNQPSNDYSSNFSSTIQNEL